MLNLKKYKKAEKNYLAHLGNSEAFDTNLCTIRKAVPLNVFVPI